MVEDSLAGLAELIMAVKYNIVILYIYPVPYKIWGNFSPQKSYRLKVIYCLHLLQIYTVSGLDIENQTQQEKIC